MMALAIVSAGNGWSGDAAKDLFEQLERTRDEARGALRGERSGEPPVSQVAKSGEELLKQISNSP